MSEPLVDPEHTPAMEVTVSKLSEETQRLIDQHGAPAVQVDPEQDNPSARELSFSEEAVIGAGFESGTQIRASDEPPYELEGEMTQPQVIFWIHKSDQEVNVDRRITLQFEADGRIVPETEEDHALPEESPGSTTVSDEAADAFMYAKLGEAYHDIFTQDECDRLRRLIHEERQLRG